MKRLPRTSRESFLYQYAMPESANLTTRLHVLGGGDHAEALVEVDGRENHALTLDAHHVARGEVGHEEDALADEFLWVLIEGSDT